ncbi:MAG TPA: MFS transporter [Actinomycetota bacterium]|nr:MFS transporter [Actinomycetota bacterium]
MRRPVAAGVRPAVAVLGLFVTFGVVVASFFPFLSIYFAGRGFDGSEIGVILAAMAVVRMIAMPIWGHVADSRIGRRRALQLGLVGMVTFAAVASVLDSFVGVAFGAVGIALAMAASGPNIDALALVELGEERMADYGRVRAWESLSYATACLLIGLVLDLYGVALALPVYGAAAAVTLAWTTIAVRSDRPGHRQDHGRLGSIGAVFRAAPRFWGFLVATLLVWTGFNGAWNFVGLKIRDPLLIGLGTALGGFTEVGVMRLASRLHRRVGLRRVFALGCFVYAIGFFLWGVIEDRTVVSLLAVFEGAGFSLLFTTSILVVGKLLPSSLYSSGNSLGAMVGFGIGPILGAGIGGVVYDELGPLTLFIGSAVLAAAGGVAALVALRTPALDTPLEEALAAREEVPPEPGRL